MKEKKIALVTGGTSGVGLSIAKALIHANYFVIIVGSNSLKGKRIEVELNSGIETNAAFVCIDLSNLASVSEFAEKFALTHDRIDLLVNAAGTIFPRRELTPEGFEKTFAIGYLSPVILSLKLADLLKKSGEARIVNVSAASKTILKIGLEFDDLSFSKSYNGFRTSLHTVHAKTVLTQILAEKFTPDQIDVNSFHPGMVRSKLTRNLPFLMRLLTNVFSPFMSTDSENGIFVSTSAELNGISGQLYEKKSPIALNFSAEYKEKLWLKTIELLQPLELDLKCRTPNYKVGWIIPGKVAALTHFHSNIIEEDQVGVFTETQKLLENVQEPFHIIIDNRHAPLERFYSLQELQGFSPFLNDPQLRSLFIVKPMHLELDQVTSTPEKNGEVILRNVDSVAEALAIMSKLVEGMDKGEAGLFFPHSL